jgi:predicted nucleotidyltransferase
MDNKSKILNYLGKHIEERFTMHNLSELLGIPYASFYRTIQKMKDLLVLEIVGKSRVVRLNVKNRVVKAHLIVSSDEERKDFLNKKAIIRKISNELNTNDVVILFGSYAKGKETGKSDIDILVINKDGKKSLSFSKYELLYKKKINPIFITRKEFRDMLRDKEENVGKQVLKGHIILNNPDIFWECVLNGI